MTTVQTPPTDLLSRALHRLVAAGTLTPEQATAVVRAVADEQRPAAPGRGRLPELLGYLGGALTAGAALVLVGSAWDDLGRRLRTALLVVTAVALVSGAVAVGGGFRGLRHESRHDESARRRLASTLLTLGEASLAGAARVAAPDGGPLLVGLVALAGGAAGYVLCRSALGHVGVLAAVLLTVGGVFESTGTDDDVAVALTVLAVGAGWAALSGTHWLEETRLGLGLGAATALAGAQVAAFGSLPELGFALTALVAAACFAGYLRLRDVGLLVVGVLAVTAVVPEALTEWTDGSLGSAGALLVAGLSLLGASAAGLRLHRAGEDEPRA